MKVNLWNRIEMIVAKGEITRYFYFISKLKYVQSRLLQNCCMRERITPFFGTQGLKDNQILFDLSMKTTVTFQSSR